MRRRERGFTLIELMIAVVIIGILASIAYPSYQRYVQQARVTDGHAKLMEVAGQLERCYTVYSSYTHENCPDPGGMKSEEKFYTLSAAVTGSSYVITATHGGELVRSACKELTISQTGETTPNECW